MSDTKPNWTPRPWTLEWRYANSDKESEIIGGSPSALYQPVAIIPHDDLTEGGVTEVAANAHLIAAAPDLYASLRRLLLEFEFEAESGLRDDAFEDIMFVNARAALAKARGEQP